MTPKQKANDLVDYLNKTLNYEKYGKERVNKRVNKRRSLA